MFWFKGCPRCSGDVYEDQDQYGPFITCVQCGFSKDIMEKLDSPAQISVEPVAAPVVPKVEGGKRRRLSHGGRHLTRSYGRRDGPFPPFAA
ncbi:MAG: hypothetical protein FJ316_09090 [SAR202 cluster bacterium]|nr:hypothetical protein [SAR202 cluster bacterium]